MVCKQKLDPLPRLPIDDRTVKALVSLALVSQPPEIDRVRQDLVDVAAAERTSALWPARAIDSGPEGESLRRPVAA